MRFFTSSSRGDSVYLKEIELENFKTFGKKTRIPFNPGYTAIIGPNGSGKSNIGDAIMFVLGPKSSKSLRAGNLTELIFNGGAKGKPARYCKVSLLFDNKDRSLPVESDLVKLTRHIKLSDTSDNYTSNFYINGQKSSLKEFENILSQARISSDGYNMVKQGLITSIVEKGPVERRRILDDVSGVAPFDRQIEKAEEERKEAEVNMERLNIILQELNEQIKSLKKDREGALKYRELLQKRQEAEALIAYKNRESVLTELNSINKDIKGYEDEIERLKKEREDVIRQKKAVENELKEAEKEMVDRGGEEGKELKERIDTLRIELARAKDFVETGAENLAGMKTEKTRLQKEIGRIEKDREKMRKELEKAAAELDSAEKSIDALKKQIEEMENRAGEKNSSIRGTQDTIAKMSGEIDDLRKKVHDLTLKADTARNTLENLNVKLAEAEERKKTLEFELKDTEWSIKQMGDGLKASKKDIKTVQEQFYAARKREKELLAERDDLDSAIKRLNREYSRLKAEAEAMESAGKGSFRSVEAILEARNTRGLKGIHGTIEDLITAEEGYDIPLQIAGANRLQAIVVDDDKRAAEAIEYLKKNRLGRATFLPLNRMAEGRPRGKAILAAQKGLGFLTDHIEYDEVYSAAIWYVLGDTVVVEDLKKARELMGGVRLVTRDGQLIEASGAMIGGEVRSRQKSGSAQSKKRMGEVNRELEKANIALENVEAELARIRKEMTELEDRLKEAGINSADEVKLSALESRKKEIKQFLSQLKTEIDALKKSMTGAEKSVKEAEKELDGLTDRIAKKEKERKELQDRLTREMDSDIGKKLRELRTALEESMEKVSRTRAEKRTLEERIRLMTERLDDLKKEFEGADSGIERIQKEIARRKKDIEDMKVELSALREMEGKQSREMEKLRTKRDELYKKKVELEGEADRITSRIETTGDYITGLRAKQSVVEEKLASLEKELEGIDVQVPEKLPSLSKLKKIVDECNTNISLLGPINMKAIEDYDEKNSRYAGIKDELERLEEERGKLIEVVDELQIKKKKTFMDVFNEVSRNLGEIYHILSRGGEASLELENPENPFEGGLIIKANPTRKKVRRIEALSGGEKSLAALSFIFAIQQARPSPFYLLDEVDMFLDADNAETVSRVIRENSDRAQFIQVTLRKVTLKQTQHVIGVMMQSDGISDIVMKPNIDEFVEETRPEEVKT